MAYNVDVSTEMNSKFGGHCGLSEVNNLPENGYFYLALILLRLERLIIFISKHKFSFLNVTMEPREIKYMGNLTFQSVLSFDAWNYNCNHYSN